MSDTAPESAAPAPAARKPEAGQTAAAERRALRKTRVGEVVSNKMAKTAVVETVTRVPHARFGKIVKQIKRFYAHDEESKAQVGDTVRIMETRPVSRIKRWRVVEILKH